MNRLAITGICIFLSACAHQQEPPPVIHPPEPVGPNIPPPARLADPQTVWREYDCDKKVLPFIIIESNEILSPEPLAGQEFKYRFVYALCVSGPPKPIKGTLKRKIFFRGKKVFQNVSKDVDVKPGRWEDIAKIKTPHGTKPGDYNFELSFSISKTKIIKDLPFVIRK